MHSVLLTFLVRTCGWAGAAWLPGQNSDSSMQEEPVNHRMRHLATGRADRQKDKPVACCDFPHACMFCLPRICLPCVLAEKEQLPARDRRLMGCIFRLQTPSPSLPYYLASAVRGSSHLPSTPISCGMPALPALPHLYTCRHSPCFLKCTGSSV